MSAPVDPVTILSLRNSIRACTKCSLRKTARAPVPWSGPLRPDILIVAEAPGSQEDVEGEPLIGSAGQLLNVKLREAGLSSVATIARTNSCQCYPGRGLSPTQDFDVIDACRTWMRAQVALLQPQFVLALGQVAFRSIWGDLTWPSLAQIHGKPVFWPDGPAPAKPTCVWHSYHPSAALRSAKYKKILLSDLRALRSWVDIGEVWPEDCYICGKDLDGWSTDGRGIPLCSAHLVRQGELAFA